MPDHDTQRKRPLDALAGSWELEATLDGRSMSVARTTFAWHGGLLLGHAEPPTSIVPEWQGLAPETTDTALGLDDHTGAFSMLYADARGVSRIYAMTLDGHRWTLRSRPGPDFHQRFEGAFAAAGDRIDGRWERSEDGETWALDFDVTYRRTG